MALFCNSRASCFLSKMLQLIATAKLPELEALWTRQKVVKHNASCAHYTLDYYITLDISCILKLLINNYWRCSLLAVSVYATFRSPSVCLVDRQQQRRAGLAPAANIDPCLPPAPVRSSERAASMLWPEEDRRRLVNTRFPISVRQQ